MILVTGAAGKTGRAVSAALTMRGEKVRAFVHRQEQGFIARESGAQETFNGDLTQTRDMVDASRGAEAIYHICPNVSPKEVEIGQAAITACIKNGVKRFVFHSVLHPHTRDMPHHWAKLQVEELLFQSGLEYTILQPASYMQNIMGNWRAIVEEGIFKVPYPPETRLSMVDLEDVAEVAAQVLSDRKHAGAIYELAGPNCLSQLEVAEILSIELAREVIASEESPGKWLDRMQGSGLGEVQLSTLVNMFEYYAKYGFVGSSVILEHLLGREATSFRVFVRRILDQT